MWPYPELIAHRCGGRHAPENTLAGLQAASRLGFGMVEFDVMLAACGTPVLIHDETLERTTDGTGAVSAHRYAELAKLDAGIKTDARFRGERIPTLAQALDCCAALGLVANVEIKPAAGFEIETAECVARAVQGWVGRVRMLLSSFSLASLSVAQQLAPQVPRGVLFESIPPDWAAQIKRLAAVSLHCDAARLTDAQLQAVRAGAVPVVCYTVNDAAQAQALFAAGVSAVFTDALLPSAG